MLGFDPQTPFESTIHLYLLFFFNDTATTEIYTLSLHDALPISSSAHLYVVPKLLGWPYHGLAFDVALHWGTLFALLMAFGGEWWALARHAFAADAATRNSAWRTWLLIAAAS